MTVIRLTEPDAFISLDEAKQHLNVDDSDHDSKILAFIGAACQYAETITGRALAPGDFVLELPAWPAGYHLCIPFGPVISVGDVTYLDETGTRQLLATSDYRVTGLAVSGTVGLPPRTVIVLDQLAGVTWPPVQAGRDPDTVQVLFRAGYEGLGSPTEPAVPEPVRNACLLMIGDWYDMRASTVVGTSAQEMPNSALALLAPYRLYVK